MKFNRNDKARRNSLELGDLALLLNDENLTKEQRERIYKAFSAVGGLLPVGGFTTVITTETIRDVIPNMIWLWPADGGSLVRTYPMTSVGLEGALGESAAGDKIVVPQDVSYEPTQLVIPDHVHLMGLGKKHVNLTFLGGGSAAMISQGTSAVISDITLTCAISNYTSMLDVSPDGSLENVKIDYNLSDTAFHHVLDNPASGEFYLKDCEIRATQASTGHLAIVRIESNTGDVVGLQSGLSSTSSGGQGYIVHKFTSSADGYLRLYGGWLYASYLATNF